MEQKLFRPLVPSTEAKALLHMFSAERGGKKISDLPRSVKPRTINSVGVVGAGLMVRATRCCRKTPFF